MGVGDGVAVVGLSVGDPVDPPDPPPQEAKKIASNMPAIARDVLRTRTPRERLKTLRQFERVRTSILARHIGHRTYINAGIR